MNTEVITSRAEWDDLVNIKRNQAINGEVQRLELCTSPGGFIEMIATSFSGEVTTYKFYESFKMSTP